MKAFTDIEQSRKLAEILPSESADAFYDMADPEKRQVPIIGNPDDYYDMEDWTIPCWSLAALFKLLPKSIEGAELSLIKTFRDDYRIVYDIYGDENITSEDYTNPIDACYEMIIRFKENNNDNRT